MKIKNSWHKKIGRIWHELFKELKLPKKGVVVEIAPGDVNKIGYGLKLYGFRGTIYIVEPHPQALASITKQYKNTLKNVKIIPLGKKLHEVSNHLPKQVDAIFSHKVDAILANHPIDDIIAGKILSDKAFEKFFKHHYTAPAERTKKIWEILESIPKKLRRIKFEVYNEFKKLIAKTKPKIVIISQYESYFFKSHGITAPDKHAFDVLKRLRKTHKKNSIFPLRLKKYVENPHRWLVLKF